MTKENKDKLALLISGIWLGIQAGISIKAWLERQSEEYPRMKRENHKLVNRLPVKKVNLLLKAVSAEEKAMDFKWELESSQKDCTTLQKELASSGIDYTIPTYLREKEAQEEANA